MCQSERDQRQTQENLSRVNKHKIKRKSRSIGVTTITSNIRTLHKIMLDKSHIVRE